MRALFVIMLSLLFTVAGCAAPAPSTQAGADVATAPQQPTSQTRNPVPVVTPEKPGIGRPVKMPPMSDPLPPERVELPSPATASGALTCKVDSDCVVKNVRNCCGYFPACVNKASPTDPPGVQEQCASGKLSVCGFPTIEGCHCVKGQCVASVPVVEPSQDPPAAEPVR